MIHNTSWPYANETGITEKLNCDVLVLGGGLAGCYAAIAAARRGQSVILVEKGAVERSGSAGTGFDHWESACTNPCSGVTPEEIAWAYVNEQDYYSNGIAHYIECREGYDRMLDMESFGGKIRDTKNEFEGAAFRDEKTKLMFAYDYKNKFTLRVWGSTFKPSLYKELKRLGVKLLEHTEATALLTSFVNGKKHGAGACAMDVHTCKFYILRAKSTVLAMSRPARVWLFDADQPGLCEFRPFQSIGSGHAMGWRSGIEFTMMEKSVRAEYSAAGRSFPAYGTGNNHKTWYAATMVDARGVEIPYVDRDGKELTSVLERYYPAPGQKFFLKGGVIDNPKYEYRGPETLDFDELIKRGEIDKKGKFGDLQTKEIANTICNNNRLPIVGEIACGGPILAEENIESYVTFSKELLGSGKFFILRAKGDSMINAGINDGDLVIVRQQETAEIGQIVVALIGNEATLKRYYLDNKRKKIRLHPENDKMEDMFFDDIAIQGIAVKVLKDLE